MATDESPVDAQNAASPEGLAPQQANQRSPPRRLTRPSLPKPRRPNHVGRARPVERLRNRLQPFRRRPKQRTPEPFPALRRPGPLRVAPASQERNPRLPSPSRRRRHLRRIYRLPQLHPAEAEVGAMFRHLQHHHRWNQRAQRIKRRRNPRQAKGRAEVADSEDARTNPRNPRPFPKRRPR